MKYTGKFENGYVKVFRGTELIAAGIYDTKVTGHVRDIAFMKPAFQTLNKIRQTAMDIMKRTVAAYEA